jgi:hypothetical protein
LGKLRILNRRYDPTSVADDMVARAVNDFLFGDYNHYSHDYARPWFMNRNFTTFLDKYLEQPKSRDVLELGITLDASGLVEFDDCQGNGPCAAVTNYIAHGKPGNSRAHDEENHMMSIRNPVPVTEGAHPESRNNLAGELRRGSLPIAMRTMDQEDLRGSVEFFFKPYFQTTAKGFHGLFAYGKCLDRKAELEPQAFIQDGKMYFAMYYQSKLYTASADLSKVPGFAEQRWAHLAFSWELPTQPVRINVFGLSETELTALNEKVKSPKWTGAKEYLADARDWMHGKLADWYLAGQKAPRDPGLKDAFAASDVGLVLASALVAPSRTTYRWQRGEGVMRIHVNGFVVAEAKLGDKNSFRECLPAQEAVNNEKYPIGGDSDKFLEPYNPYSDFPRSEKGNVINFDIPADAAKTMGSGGAGEKLPDGRSRITFGKRCKGYKVRNLPVYFGCARVPAVTAEGAFDDVSLIFGPGRRNFENVDRSTGMAKSWLE